MLRRFCTLAAGLAMSFPAFGQITVSNLGETAGVNQSAITFDNNSIATQFTVDSEDYSLNSVTINIGSFQYDDQGNFRLSLWDEVAGKPGTLLEVLSGTANPVIGLNTYTSSGYSLSGGTSYFIAGEVTSGDGGYHWILVSGGNETNTGGASWTIDGSATGTQSFGWFGTTASSRQLSITATAVPEPASFAILTSLFAFGLVSFRRKRRR